MKSRINKFILLTLCIYQSLPAFCQSKTKEKLTISIYGGVKLIKPTQLGKWVASERSFVSYSHKHDFPIFGIDCRIPFNKKLGIVSGLSFTGYNSVYEIDLFNDDMVVSQTYMSSCYAVQLPVLFSFKAGKRWNLMLGPTINYFTSNKDETLDMSYYSFDSSLYYSTYGSKYKNKISSSVQLRFSYAPSKWSALTFIANYDILSSQSIEYRAITGSSIYPLKDYDFLVEQKFFSAALVYQLYLKGSVFDRKSRRKHKMESEVNAANIETTNIATP